MAAPQKNRIAPIAERSRIEMPLSEIQSPLVRTALELWQSVRGERRMPKRSEMTPRAMASILSNIVIVRVVDGGAEFEFRIVGHSIRVVQGAALQGKTMAEIDEVLPGYGSVLRPIYRRAVDLTEPVAFRGWYTRPGDADAPFQEVIVLPLSDDGKAVDHLLVVAA